MKTFNKHSMSALLLISTSIFSNPVFSDDNQYQNEKQINQLREEYEQRLSQLEASNRLSKSNSFNPQLSVILDGQFSAYRNHADDYEIPGFVVGGEAGLKPEGFSLGHSEITASANVDDKFLGKLTLALANHENETEVELEEAFIQSTAMPYGLSVQAGRFFSSVGYVNQQHDHAWDFADAPLVYAGLWGNKYIDDGLRVTWLAPTDFYWELGAEAFSGGGFPAGGDPSDTSGSQVAFMNVGGDFNASQSWQFGLSYHQAEVNNRIAGGHSHGAAVATEFPSFSGDSDTQGANFIYKWAPNGNYKNKNFKFQAEFFSREEQGDVVMLESTPLEQSSLSSEQKGYYLQAVYQFIPQWRVGLRYDHLSSQAEGNDSDVLEEAGLDNEGISPKRSSVMLEWIPSEFSRLRLQFNDDASYEEKDKQVLLQYTMSLGTHGAHAY